MALTAWRPCADFPGYEISADGRVRSTDRILRFGRNYSQQRLYRGQELRQSPNPNGYLTVSLRHRDGKRRTAAIHVLLCTAFHGPRRLLHEARHLNDVKTDNRVDNIAWGTKSQNALDAVRNGKHPSRKTA